MASCRDNWDERICMQSNFWLKSVSVHSFAMKEMVLFLPFQAFYHKFDIIKFTFLLFSNRFLALVFSSQTTTHDWLTRFSDVWYLQLNQSFLINILLKEVQVVLSSISFEYHELKSTSIAGGQRVNYLYLFFSLSFLSINKITNLTFHKHQT